MRGPSRRRRLLGATIPALGLVAGSLLPAARPLPLDLCLLHRLTGIPCLTCGLTRSVCFLLQGDPATSFALHPAGALVVVLLALHALWRGFEAVRGEALARPTLVRLTGALGGAGAILSAGAWVARLAQA